MPNKRVLPLKPTQKTVVWLIAVVMLMAVGMVFTFWSYSQIEQASNRRQDSRIVLTAADDFLSSLATAESSQRGYAITGGLPYLAPYQDIRDNITAHLAVLRQMTTSAPAQQHVDTAAPLLATKLTEMDKTIAFRRNQDAIGALALINSDEGQRLTDAIRKEMLAFIQIESDIQSRNNTAFDNSLRRLLHGIIGLGVLAVLIALFFGYVAYRGVQQRLKSTVHKETQHLLAEQLNSNALLQFSNDALQDSTQKLTVTLNAIGDAVISTDEEARVTLLNPVAQAMTGWTQAQAQGRPIAEIFNIVNKADRQVATIPVAKVLAMGTVQGLANHTVLIARDGTEYDIADSCAPVRDLKGDVVGAVLIFRNVTAEYAAQQTLRDSAARVQTILNTVSDGIVTLHALGSTI